MASPALASPGAAGLLAVPPDHPVYEHLEHFRALGLVRGSLELRPMTRGRLVEMARVVMADSRAGGLGSGDRARLRGLCALLEEWGLECVGDPGLSSDDDGRGSGGRNLPPTTWELSAGLAFQGAYAGVDSLPDIDRRQRREEAFLISMDAAMGERITAQSRFYEDYSHLSPQPCDRGWVDNMPRDLRGTTQDPSARNHRATVGIGASWIQARLGREERWWGTGSRGTLFLSENPFPMDGISLSFRTRYVSGASLFAQTARGPDRVDPAPADRRVQAGASAGSPPGEYPQTDAYFAAHRFEFSPPGPVRIGVYEAAAYGGRGIDFGYLNPVSFLVAVTQDIYDRSGTDDKKVLGVDLSLQMPPFHIHGEFLLNRLVSGDSAPFGRDSQISSFAQLAGLRWANPFGWSGAAVECEYVHLDPEVYFHHDQDPTRAMLHEGELIGHWAGPNADAFFLALQPPPMGRSGRLRLEFEQIRWGLIDGVRGAEAGFTGMQKRDKRWITGPIQTERTVSLVWSRQGWRTRIPGRLGTSLLLARVDRTGEWREEGWFVEMRLRWEYGRVFRDW